MCPRSTLLQARRRRTQVRVVGAVVWVQWVTRYGMPETRLLVCVCMQERVGVRHGVMFWRVAGKWIVMDEGGGRGSYCGCLIG